MLPLVTVINAALQIMIVGLGASIGREAAPRELGALAAGRLSENAGISARERRILFACGAGAGLAAVYSVPFGGEIFTVEIVLAEISYATALPGFGDCGDRHARRAPQRARRGALLAGAFLRHPLDAAWLIIVGPLMGFATIGFVRLAQFAQIYRPKSSGILIVMPLVFAGVGMLSVVFRRSSATDARSDRLPSTPGFPQR